MKKVILGVEGMTCSACSNGLEKYLNKQKGIINASVNLVMANVSISYDDNILSQEDLDNFIKKAGFKSLGIFKILDNVKTRNREKNKFIIFTILALILLYIAMGHMINLPIFDFLSISLNPKGYASCLFLFSIIFIIYGFDILKNGYKNFIHLSPNMDSLVSLGVVSSFSYSVYNMVLLFLNNTSLIHNLYFESVAMVIYFIKLGRFIDGISKDKTKKALDKLVSITPEYAYVKENEKIKKVTIDEVKVNDIVISRAGEKIAVDGVITYGSSHTDESFITGESKPVLKKVNDNVIAGSINYDGYIEYKAIKIGKDSTISTIVKLVIEASNTKAPIAKIADKVSGYFVPIVIFIAVMTFIVNLLLTNSFSESLITFTTILVVACPCSLGLATPLAVVVSEGLCASFGILVKKSEILESACKIDTVVFDKTGTLTYGKLKITDLHNFSSFSDNEILQLVASLESKSTHPISLAFQDYAKENKIELKEVKNFNNLSGYGIVGDISSYNIIVGNNKVLKKYNIENNYSDIEKKITTDGYSIFYVVINREIVALIGLSDIVRDNATDVIKRLNELNIKTIMLTGDSSDVANKIASRLGINEVKASLLPLDKADIINKLKSEGRKVLMCGDGINDAIALTSATIGVSIKSGTDIAMDSSDVILIKNDLNSIIRLLDISKRTIKIIKQNLFWAFFYNLLMIPLAMGLFKNFGLSLNPMLASLAMVISSLSVILNTLRLKK